MKPPYVRADYGQNPPSADLIKVLRTEKKDLLAIILISDKLDFSR